MKGEWLLAAAALMVGEACTHGTEAGDTMTCLYADDVSVTDGAEANVDVTGEVIADEPWTDAGGWCSAVASRALTIDADNGVTYRLGYGMVDGDLTDITLPMPVFSGDTVRLLFRHRRPFGEAAGFALSNDDGLIAALEMGTWGPGLQEGDIPGLTVSAGASVGTERTECGVKTFYELRFAGDDDLRLAPVDHDAFTLDDQRYQAWAISRFEWPADPKCEDLAGEELWAVWLER